MVYSIHPGFTKNIEKKSLPIHIIHQIRHFRAIHYCSFLLKILFSISKGNYA